MSRSYSPDTLVALPNLSAVSAAALMAELLNAAANEAMLPALVASDRDALAESHEGLQIQLGKRLAGEGEAQPKVAAADLVEDNAFGALSGWLLSFARLPHDRHPEAASAPAIHETLFPQGLAFLAIRPSDEWQEAETRLRLIKEKGFDLTIEKLGGKPFLDELAAAHEAYGKALGITAVKQAPEAAEVRQARDAALEAVRTYVLRVVAHVKKSDAETTALAERLLAPLSNYKRKPRKQGAQGIAAPSAAPPAPASSNG